MKRVGIILAILVAANTCMADENKAPGSRKRNYHQQTQMNIEDIIRAEEDPDFLQYLKERERQKKEERAAILAYEKQHQAEEEAYQKAQRQYLKEENERVAREATKVRKYEVDEQKVWAQEQEKYRKEYIANHNKQVEKLESERMARIQRVQSLLRMPASN